MAAQGWVSVRNLPSTKDKSIKEVLDKFKRTHRICSDCDGAGYTVNKYNEIYEGVSTVRVSDHNGLKEMSNNGTLTKETFTRIFETMVHNRKTCDKCNGLGFEKKKLRKKKGVKKAA